MFRLQSALVIVMMAHMTLLVAQAQLYNGCPEQCKCTSQNHFQRGSAYLIKCTTGGMTEMPVQPLNVKVDAFIIDPESNPNDFQIGLSLIQPAPMRNLRVLKISNSNLMSTGENSFWGLGNLKTLDLTNNNISNVSVNSFRGLDKLEVLSLDNNKMSNLPSAAFGHMGSLTQLTMRHNLLKKLPARLFKTLGKLKILDISYNELSELEPDTFKDVQNVRILKCRKCSLTHINSRLYHILPLIEELDLGDNYFMFMEYNNFLDLRNLKVLDYDRNQLTAIENGCFAENKKLQRLNLAKNRIEILSPRCFQNFTNLTHLDISYNRLKKLEIQTFAPIVSSLRSINISGNPLKLKNNAALIKNMTKVQILGLADLSLKSIPPDIFNYCTNIRSLNISRNYFSSFPLNVLNKTRFLQDIDISNNLISTLNENDLARMEAIAQVNIESNPWSCDPCDLENMLVFMESSVLKQIISTLHCRTPEQLNGVLIPNLQTQLCWSSPKGQKTFATWVSLIMVVLAMGATVLLYCSCRDSSSERAGAYECDPVHLDEVVRSSDENASGPRAPRCQRQSCT